MDQVEFCRLLGIRGHTLELWVEQSWIRPRWINGSPEYTEADVARAQLILELFNDFEIDATGVDVFLLLLDQIHGLRAKLDALLEAVYAQDENTRRRIASYLVAKPRESGSEAQAF